MGGGYVKMPEKKPVVEADDKKEGKKEKEKEPEPIHSECAKAWQAMFLENKTIAHLDLSHNNFKQHEINTMGNSEFFIF
jgi:hypothetical protein